jgi:site-specific recombinase XerD
MTNHSPPLTLPEVLPLYRVEHLAGRNLAPLTRQAYVRDIEDLLAWLDTARAPGTPAPVDAVSRPDLERYLTHLDTRGLTVAYRRRKVAALRSFFGFLQDRDLLLSSPATNLVPPPKEDPHSRVLTETECTRLLEAVRHEPRDGAIIAVLLQTGLRLSELSQLRVDDVTLPFVIRRPQPATRESGNVGVVTVQGKGRKQRTVTLTWKACTAIKAYLAVRPTAAEDDRLFVTKFRRGMGPRAIERVVEKYLIQAGIAEASVQSLRHTFATHQLRRGIKLDTVRQALGHASVATTSIYVGLVRDVMDKELQEHAL